METPTYTDNQTPPENTATPVTAQTIRDWCGDPRTSVSVRSVLDIAESLHADSYEVPARLREQVRLRDGTCIFPGCHARGLCCQDDHCDPYDHDHPGEGGQTESGNLGLLCQRHHNLKTHHGFTYTILKNGAVLWRTPHGLRIRRHHDGTTQVEGLPQPGASGAGDSGEGGAGGAESADSVPAPGDGVPAQKHADDRDPGQPPEP